jgi:pimeloyl-[acyl-carrier protein] synthase
MPVYDPRVPEILADPYPSYANWRAEGPVTWSDVLQAWVVVGHAEVTEVLKSREVSAAWFGDRRPYAPEVAAALQPANEWLSRMLLFADPPEHARLRTITTKAFTPRVTEELRPIIERLTDELLDGVLDRGEMELVGDFAFPLPVSVIGHLLGVPVRDHSRIRDWSELISRFVVNSLLPPEQALAVNPAIEEISEYLGDLVRERRENPQADLISAMVQAEEQGRYLDTDELVINFALLLLAGHETTSNMIGLAVHTLFEHPDQLAKLVANPGLIPEAVDELLRFDSSVQFLSRVGRVDLTIGDVTVPAGQPIYLCLGAANRDPRRYPEADQFVVGRGGERHGSFGAGIHFCIGASLTRAELEIALRQLLNRLPGLRPVSAEREWRPVVSHRGLRALPVAWDRP